MNSPHAVPPFPTAVKSKLLLRSVTIENIRGYTQRVQVNIKHGWLMGSRGSWRLGVVNPIRASWRVGLANPLHEEWDVGVTVSGLLLGTAFYTAFPNDR